MKFINKIIDKTVLKRMISVFEEMYCVTIVRKGRFAQILDFRTHEMFHKIMDKDAWDFLGQSSMNIDFTKIGGL